MKNKTIKKIKSQTGGVRLRNPYLYQDQRRPQPPVGCDYPPLINPKWRVGTYPWSTLIKIEGLTNTNIKVYGTSMPISDDLEGIIEPGSTLPYLDYNIYCFRTFLFYMYNLEVNRLISLQACDDNSKPPQPSGCGTDLGLERRMWENVKNMNVINSRDANILYETRYIQDMHCGDYNTWLNILNVDYTLPQNSSIIHCYAGFGRTGSILFGIIMKYYLGGQLVNTDTLTPLNIPVINIPDIGTHLMRININHFESSLKDLMKGFLKLVNTDYNYINVRINGFNLDELINELFSYNNTYHLNLFLYRYNTLLLCMATIYNVPTIPLYKRVEPWYNITGNNLGEILNDIYLNHSNNNPPLYDRNNVIHYINGTIAQKQFASQYFEI